MLLETSSGDTYDTRERELPLDILSDGSSAIIRAYSENGDDPITLKVYPHSDEGSARCSFEQSILAALTGIESIPVLSDSGELLFPADERNVRFPFVAHQWIDGYSLNRIILSRTLMKSEQIAYLGAHLSHTLLHMQDAPGGAIIHRDIKPENILVQGPMDGINVIWLIDFDSAIRLGQDRYDRTLRGTPHYIAPEVFASPDNPSFYLSPLCE